VIFVNLRKLVWSIARPFVSAAWLLFWTLVKLLPMAFAVTVVTRGAQ